MSHSWADRWASAAQRSRRAIVVIEEAAETLTTLNAAGEPLRTYPVDQGIPEPLVIALDMIVLDEFSKSSSQMALSKGDHAVQAFVSDRPHESLGVRVGIGRLKWGLHDPDSRLLVHEQVVGVRR
jgi:hypothetical protein